VRQSKGSQFRRILGKGLMSEGEKGAQKKMGNSWLIFSLCMDPKGGGTESLCATKKKPILYLKPKGMQLGFQSKKESTRGRPPEGKNRGTMSWETGRAQGDTSGHAKQG